MNRLIYNYKTKILDVIDAQTFQCEIDFGLRRHERTRLQMLNPYPDYLNKGEDRDAAEAAFRTLLMIDDTRGREVIMSPTRPNAYNKYYAILYLQCKFSDMTIPATTCPHFAGYKFINVNLLLGWLAEHSFDLTLLGQVMSNVGIEDEVLKYIPRQRTVANVQE